MTKILTWVKRKYQWENEGLSRAYRSCCYVVLGVMVVFLILTVVGDYVGLGQTFKTTLGISASGLGCFILGFAFAVRWADEKSKNSS